MKAVLTVAFCKHVIALPFSPCLYKPLSSSLLYSTGATYIFIARVKKYIDLHKGIIKN